MTNEEFERLKNSIRINMAGQPDPEAEKARRKLDRDLDRIEKVLTRCLNDQSRRPPSDAEKRLDKALDELTQKRSRHSPSDNWLDLLKDRMRSDRDSPLS